MCIRDRIKAPHKREIVAFKHQLEQAGLEAVSYTHLDVYKRQVQLSVLREVVNEGQDRVAVEQPSLALTGVGHIRKLMRRNVELLCENLPVASRLIEHIEDVYKRQPL